LVLRSKASIIGRVQEPIRRKMSENLREIDKICIFVIVRVKENLLIENRSGGDSPSSRFEHSFAAVGTHLEDDGQAVVDVPPVGHGRDAVTRFMLYWENV